MEEIIRVENLTHTYGEGTPFCRSAVQDMSLAIYRGEFLGIIGHTGSGKSTLIQHLNGLLKPTSGRILLGGEDIWADPKKIRDVRFRVGLVFQYPEYQLFEETVYRDIAFGPTNMGLPKDEIDRRVRESAHFAGLTDDLLEKSLCAKKRLPVIVETAVTTVVQIPETAAVTAARITETVAAIRKRADIRQIFCLKTARYPELVSGVPHRTF